MKRFSRLSIGFFLLILTTTSWGDTTTTLSDLQKSMDQMQQQMNSPEFKKMQRQAKKLQKQAEQNPNATANWEKNQKSLQYTDIVIKTHLDYTGDYKSQYTPNAVLKSHRRIVADRDFQGRFWKTLPEANQGIVDYGFDNLAPDKLSVLQATGYTVIEGKGPSTRCEVTDWKEGPGNMGGIGTAAHGLLMNVDPGVQTPGVCKNSYGSEKADYPTAILENPPLHFVMTPEDFKQLEKEGHIERDYSGMMTYSPGMDLLSAGKRLVFLSTDPLLKDWSYQGVLHVEIMSSPVISGPHFLAQATETLGLTDNQITLRTKTPNGWQVGKITPIGGWANASKIVKNYMEIPGSEQRLILKPEAPGKVKFEVEWTNPKGKRGKSPAFEVTVVQLNFKKKDICQGYDDTSEKVNSSIDGVSLCTDLQKTVALDIKPAGTSIDTRLVAAPAIKMAGNNRWKVFPHDVVMQGLRASNEILHVEVMVDKDVWQLATDLSVDVLKMRHIKVLPVILNPNALDIDQGSEFFSVANDDMKQLCVVLDKMHSVPLEDRLVPGYTEGGEVRYDGPGQGALTKYANDHMQVGQEVTAFFVPKIVTDKKEALAGDVVGFQSGNTVFIWLGSAYPHLLSHEVGHYIFGEMYTSLEGFAHTHDQHMIMYHNTSSGCEYRQKEWRKAH